MHLRGALADRRGVSAIEFGVVVPIIGIIILGTYDLGNLVQQRMKLADAVRAGGQYAMSYPTSTSGIRAAVTAALPAGWTGVTVGSPTTTCACWSAGGGETAASCAADPVCPAGQVTERFVTLTASRTYTPLLLVSFTSVSANYVARVQ